MSLLFYYYGRKKQIARYYPASELEAIVEPFAGAAAYSLYGNNWKKRVILVERDERVAEIWKWLINDATSDEIRGLPALKVGESSSEFLHIIHAATKMAFKYKTIKVTPVLERNWEISKRLMAADLYKIKHWELITGDYSLAPDIEATWFIDPPYKDSPGDGYAYGSSLLNYKNLADWACQRKGQVICCEGENGDYMPFRRLLNLPGVAGKRSMEKIYHRSTTVCSQQDLFSDAIVA